MTPHTSATHIIRVLLILLLPTAGGCFSRMGEARDPFSGTPSETEGRIRVEVQNLNFNDATIYAVRGGQEIRVGRLTGKTDERYNLSWAFTLPLQFRIDLVGGRRCSTIRIQVDPGDQLFVQIPSNVGVTPCRLIKR